MGRKGKRKHTLQNENDIAAKERIKNEKHGSRHKQP